MMEEDLDLEDLEWRLYSQIYHSKEGNEENSPICENLISEVPTVSTHPRKTYRYFQNRGPQLDPPSGSQTYIALSNNEETGILQEPCISEIRNDITFDSNSSTVVTNCDTSQFHNNVTVNQFTVPVIIHPHGALSSPPQQYFKPWSKLTQRLLPPSKRDKKKPNKNKGKSKVEKISKWAARLRKKQSNEVTVFLSDDSNDDCVIVENNINNDKLDKINTGFPKKYIESEGGQKPESDDDIIYIPPPPIEVINIEENDVESTSVITLEDKSSSSEDILKDVNFENSLKTSNNPEENEVSNDFLDIPQTESIASKFNFSLHGSDFNSSQGDFVRPSTKQPVENCETESSCSTNELNRDFSNTVKTIVFDEVEFPKEDIFSDKNLENFSSFITPKRNSKSCKEISVSRSPKVNVEKIQDHTSSDDTSSESDYGDHFRKSISRKTGNDSKYKILPDLSPMVPVNETPRRSTTTKKNAKSFFHSGSKTELTKSENKHKTESPKKPLKKKKKRGISDSEYEEGQCSSDDDEEKMVKKKSDFASVSAVSDLDEKSLSPDKRKKKKRKLIIKEHSKSKSDTEVSYVPDKLKKKTVKGTSVTDERLETEKENTKNSEKESIEHKENSAGDCAVDVDTSTIRGNEACENIEVTNVEDSNVYKENVSEVMIAPEKSKRKKRKSTEVWPDISENEIEDVPEKLKKKKKKRDPSSDKLSQTDIKQSTEEGAKASTIQDENLIDKSNESSSVAQDSTETIKKSEITQDDSKIESHPTDIEKIEINSDVEVITDSDSDSDFLIFDCTENDIELANCFSPTKVAQIEKPGNIKNSGEDGSHTTPAFVEFDVDFIQSKQSDNPEKWQISYRDRAIYFNMDGNRGPRCNRCRHFGHTALKCLEKPEPPSCYLCGQQNHRESRCPNKRCTQCGNLGEYSTSYCWKCFKFRHTKCRICKMKGHLENACPDLWRRYHSTVDEGPIVVSRNQMKPRNKQWCSGCARQGHLEHECNYNREYPPTTPYIMNYEDNLAQEKDRLPRFLVENQDSPENAESTSAVSSNQPTANLPLPVTDSLPDHLQSVNQFPEPNRFSVPNQLSLLELPTPNQIANLNQILAPGQMQFLSQLPVLNQLQTLAMIQNQNVVPNPLNPNFANALPNRVLNPCSISNSASTSTTVTSSKNDNQSSVDKFKVIDMKEIKQIILSMPAPNVNDFLRKEMNELENSDIQPRALKNKLYKYDRTTRQLTPKMQREKAYWFRLLNMFIFGRHKIGDGRLHVSYLRKYLTNSSSTQLDDHKRRSLLSSYLYIFTHDKHKNVNYYKWINILIHKSNDGKLNKYIS